MKCIALLLILAACKHGSAPTRPIADTEQAHSTFAPDDEPPPPYDKAALGMALIAERAAEARAEGVVSAAESTSDELRLARALADLAVRRRFIAVLEVCEADGRLCPPRLDEPAWPYLADSEEDPKLDVPLRFDVESWRKVTAELHGRACACRTLTCLDSMDAMLTRLEARPIEDVQGDDTASTAIMRARDCLMRLRGKRALPRLARDPD